MNLLDSKSVVSIAQKFYSDNPDYLQCDRNNDLILSWLDAHGLVFSRNNLKLAGEELADQFVLRYSEEEVNRMNGDDYKRLVLPYCKDISEEHRKQLAHALTPVPDPPADELRKLAVEEFKERKAQPAVADKTYVYRTS